MIIFKYKEESISNTKEKVKRPVADVYMKSLSNAWIKFHPYIDSGADITIIPLSLGKLLGFRVDEEKVEQIGGIRGSVPVIYTKTLIKIGREEFQAKIAWSLVEDVPPLLGRIDIFDRFEITFKQKEDKIIFQK